MNNRHPQTKLRRTQLYLSDDARRILDMDCEHLAKDANGRAIRVLSDRLEQILIDYAVTICVHMPELNCEQWTKLFAELRKDSHAETNDISANPTEFAIRDAFYRFESFDPSIPVADRLLLAGCRLSS